MITPVVAIGNSKGVRLPKTVLQQCQISNEVNLEVKNGKIVLEPIRHGNKHPRKNWDRAFKDMRKIGDDRLLIADSLDLDTGDWKW